MKDDLYEEYNRELTDSKQLQNAFIFLPVTNVKMLLVASCCKVMLLNNICCCFLYIHNWRNFEKKHERYFFECIMVIGIKAKTLRSVSF